MPRLDPRMPLDPTAIPASQYITLADAANLLPKNHGKKVHVRTIKRWIVNGTRGVRLAGKKIGWKWYTTAEWLREFEEACSSGSMPNPSSASSATPEKPEKRATFRTPAQIARDQDRVDRELARRFGIGLAKPINPARRQTRLREEDSSHLSAPTDNK
jgi:hypothetical protein